jgi:DNA-binding transcriptional LysR family regulator
MPRKKRLEGARVHLVYPKLEELRWFLATVKHGTAQKAAKSLGMGNFATIPNANRRIQDQVGVKLLNRNNTLTEAGQVFATHAARVLKAHERMLKESAKVASAQAALPPATVHVENWLLDKFHLSSLKLDIRTIVTYDEPMDLYEAAKNPGRRGVFIITNSAAAASLSGGKLASTKLLEYKLKLYGQHDISFSPMRWLDMDCFGRLGASLQDNLPTHVSTHCVGCVSNPTAMRYALLGNCSLAGWLPEEWADGLLELFPEKVPVTVPVWMLAAVQSDATEK